MISRQQKIESDAATLKQLAHEAGSRPAAGSATGTYIKFVPMDPNPKTKVWGVASKDGGGMLGTVSWYGPWRKYSYFPQPCTVYEQVCLREIAGFCEAQTKLHKSPNDQAQRLAANNPKA